jgi:hypothetical protein
MRATEMIFFVLLKISSKCLLYLESIECFSSKQFFHIFCSIAADFNLHFHHFICYMYSTIRDIPVHAV